MPYSSPARRSTGKFGSVGAGRGGAGDAERLWATLRAWQGQPKPEVCDGFELPSFARTRRTTNCAVDCRYHKPPGASAMLRKATPPGRAVVMRMRY